jgi:hypothetical protein
LLACGELKNYVAQSFSNVYYGCERLVWDDQKKILVSTR